LKRNSTKSRDVKRLESAVEVKDVKQPN